MATRVVHRVRCRKKGNSRIWADVKVVDAFSIVAPGGKEMLIWTRAKDAKPCIVDKTKGGNGKGDPSSCTRISHMEIVEDPADSKQKMYIEKLDGIAFAPPTFHPADTTGPLDNQEVRNGLPDPATFGKGPYAITCPESQASKLIVDKTGLGLGKDNAQASRAMHVSLVTEKGNTDDKTDGIKDQGDSVPPKKMAWCAVVKVDGINVKVPNGNITMLINKGIQSEIDSTKMTTDPDTHEPCPPDNTDPNVYVDFPTPDTDGDSIGASVKIPAKGPIDMGPLWWIERISPTFRPWFWYANVNEPQAFSFFGSPGSLGSWPWRGFILWNNYPVIWILSRNNPLSPMGKFGSHSLNSCALAGNWDSSYPPTPSNTFLAPPHAVSGFPFASLGLIPPEFLGKAEPDPTFAPFGGLPMTQPPLKGPLNKGLPNVWQLTGRTQPPLSDPKKDWDPFTNPYTPPTSKDAENLAFDYRSRWNAAANGHNQYIRGYQPAGHVSSYDQPPGWSWEVPYFNNLIPANRFAFQNGIPPGIATPQGLPLVVYTPATSWTMDVDQLDPKIWDDTHLEYYNNPFNALFTTILQPFPWDNDPWVPSGSFAAH